MFAFRDTKQIQIEITQKCQAQCPMCPRNIHGGIDNPSLNLKDWSLQDFIEIFNEEVLSQIDLIIFCGNFGDPVLNNDLLGMCEYVKNQNKDVEISIHSNAGLRNRDWWRRLASVLPKKHTVYFAIDGLQYTNHLYRRNTDYNKIIDNAKAFIGAKGRAVWMFIKFAHNQHQVEDAKKVSEKLGFADFKQKESKRFGTAFPVVDKHGKFLYNIKQPDDSNIQKVDYDSVANYKSWPKATEINCFADNDKELYIDVEFRLMPCCMIGSFLFANYDVALYKKYNLNDKVLEIGKKVQDEIFSLIEEFGGDHALNVKKHSIQKVMNTDSWQKLLKYKWKNKQSPACIILCSADSPYIQNEDQWVTGKK